MTLAILLSPVAWPRRRYLTTCSRHPECADDAVMGARCLGYVDAVVTGTPAPEWEPEPALAERIGDFTHRNWEEYARVFGAGSEGVDLDDYAGASYGLMRIPEPEPLPTLLPEALQGIRTLGQWTQRTMIADDARVVIHPRRSDLAAALRGLSRPPST